MIFSKVILTCKIAGINFFQFFNSFSTRKCLDLFEVTLPLIFFNSVSKFVFVTKFASFNLASKAFAVKLLNSGVVMYFS